MDIDVLLYMLFIKNTISIGSDKYISNGIVIVEKNKLDKKIINKFNKRKKYLDMSDSFIEGGLKKTDTEFDGFYFIKEDYDFRETDYIEESNKKKEKLKEKLGKDKLKKYTTDAYIFLNNNAKERLTIGIEERQKKYDIEKSDMYITDWGEIMLVDKETEANIEIMKKELFYKMYGDWFNGPMGYSI